MNSWYKGAFRRKSFEAKGEVMTNPLVVIEDNEPTYPDPIKLNRGDVIIVGEEDSEFFLIQRLKYLSSTLGV